MGKAGKGKDKGGGKGKGKGRGKRGCSSDRARVKKLTQEIVHFAKRRRLEDAKRVFRQIVEEEGLTPGQLTYSSMVNAHVAGGDMAGAERVFQQMRDAGVPANTVVCNTLLKGYCAAGETAQAATLLEEMSSQGAQPSTSTVNAYLRCCLRAGGVAEATSAFARMADAWSAEPDLFTYKRVAQILARGLRLDALRALRRELRELQRDRGGPGLLSALTWLRLHLGMAAALLGEWATSRRALSQVEAAGVAAAVAPEVHLLPHAEQASCDRGQHEFHGQVFRGEMERLRGFLESRQALAEEASDEQMPAPDLLGPFCRTLVFRHQAGTVARAKQGGHQAVANAQEAGDLAAELAASSAQAFGLDACEERGAITVAAVERRLRRCLVGGCLSWPQLFRAGGTRREQRPAAELPLKMEICSGHGEWVVAQARAEEGVANWAALELRYDRVHCIFSRMVFESASNLCLLGGDAAQILPRHIAPGSVDHIFVNFPEPPHTHMLDGAGSDLHLLTADFFESMHQALRSGGRVTILSDSYKYSHLLARTAAALRAGGGFESVLGLRGRGRPSDSFEDIEGQRLYHGVPGKKAGHAVSSVSYFDRLWDTDERYFLVLAKP